MTDLRNQRRLAAEVLKCGENRVWIDPLHIDEVAQAVTRQDVRGLVKRGLIDAKQKQGVSRARARHTDQQKQKGRRQGPGSRKGASGARQPKKRRWIKTIRPIRRVLKYLRDEGHISRRHYRHYYRQAKGGVFRSKSHMVAHLRMDGVLSDDVEIPKLRARHEAAGAAPAPVRAPEEALDAPETAPDVDEEE